MRRALMVLALAAAVLVSPAGGTPAQGVPSGSGRSAAPQRVLGDFDNDGFDDLAVGVPGEAVGPVQAAGVVNVLYGASGQLSGAGSQMFSQDTPGVGSTAEASDRFGGALAVGDFDGDGFDDLAVAAPTEAVGTVPAAGAVNVLYGASSGLTGTGSQLFTQASLGGGATSGSFENFGSALAAGDLDGDDVDDLAIGVPFGNADAGAVHVLYGATGGLTDGRPTTSVSQDSPGVGSTAEPFDEFGASLAVGDFNDSGVSDLAVGVPSEDVGSIVSAGVFHVLFGRTTGLSGISSQMITQDTPGVHSDAQPFDRFGSAFGPTDFDGDGFPDLAIAADNESVGPIPGAGAIFVFDGGNGGLQIAGNRVLHQDVAGIGSTAEDFDGFGWAMATGDFNGDGFGDVGVGVPFESVGPIFAAGAINVLYGSGGGLSGSGSQLFHQDVAGVVSTAEELDRFGWSLGSGDFDESGADDLAIGVPGESVGTIPEAGAINVTFGGNGGLTGGQVLHQDVAGIGSTAEDFDGACRPGPAGVGGGERRPARPRPRRHGP
jgi:hypothetical protein